MMLDEGVGKIGRQAIEVAVREAEEAPAGGRGQLT